MNELSTLVHNVDWSTVWLALGGGSAVAVFSQVFKKVFKLESEKVIQFLVVAAGFAASGLQYVLSRHNIPPSILGLHTAALVGIAQPLYLYFVKPADKLLTDVKNYQASQSATIPGSTTSTTTSISTSSGNTTSADTPPTPPAAPF